jgi:putative ABC transport system permease protein
MFALSIAQLRAHTARLVATCLAIIIAVGFVVATLVLNQTSKTTVLDSVGAQYRNTDAVITADLEAPGDDNSLDSRKNLVQTIRAIPGVGKIAVDHTTYTQVRLPGAHGYRFAQVTDVAADKSLQWQRMVAGRLPTALGEVAVGERKGVSIGTTVTLLVAPPDQISDDSVDPAAAQAPETIRATVVGLVDLGGLVGMGADQVFAVPAQTAALGPIETDTIRVASATGADSQTLAPRIHDALTKAGQRNLFVRTGEQEAQQIADGYTGDAAGLAMILLVFGTVAVLVCGLVIANTFAVLLAQRTRELALLRCVGATGKQLRRGVLIESLVIGSVASLVGVGAGIALAAGVSAIAGQFDSVIPLAGVSVPWSAVAIGMAIGIVVTAVAAFAPARRATRVAPLAALRPMDPPPARSKAGLLRRGAGLVLLIPSAAALGYGAFGGKLPIALGGGVFSFLAVVLLAQWLVPPVVALAGRLLGPAGRVPGRLAASNSVRNPQRTAATATALIIGVTLTTTMVVGAASTRASTASMLDRAFPTDVSISSNRQGLPAALERAIAAVPNVQAVTSLTGAYVKVAGKPDSEDQLYGIDPVRAAPVVRSTVGAGIPKPGTVNVPDFMADVWGTEGTVTRIVAGKRSVELKVHIVSADTPLAVTSTEMARLAPKAPATQLWIRLVDGLKADGRSDVIDQISDTAADFTPNSYVQSSTEQRDSFDKMVNILLLIVTGLLGVAVVIAVIGVGNTIALSVVERRQEAGLLRALGLTRAQLRWMLLWEAALIAGVASVLGMALGAAYGVLGTSAALAGEANLKIGIPWLQLLLILTVATAAGALASVLPSRRAARISPVAAIAA